MDRFVNLKVVRALVKRDLRMYFNNPTGYVFITLFIFLSAAAAFWQDSFFLSNLANLDQLNAVFPLLLVLFIPALTMAIWSEEKKQGTDELLLTLPATDIEVVLGKYLATLGVYTASLLLSLSHILILYWLGRPDLGLMLGNYLGYWMAGSALIAAGMLASLLTANMTIAFVLGAGMCAVLVFIDSLGGVFSSALGRFLVPLGLTGHFGELARGIVSLPAVLYFATVAAFFLYLNAVLIGRRHWPIKADGYKMSWHQTARVVAVAVALISVNAMIGRSSARVDVTAEGLHRLSSETHHLLSELGEDRPVFIHAYVSSDVPEQLVQTRANLLSVLREIDVEAGPRVQLLIVETEPFSDEATDARERFGILPQQVPNMQSARTSVAEVFLGVAITCGANEQVIPFLDRGLPVEYELARSIRVVARTERKKIGVVAGELKVFGGMDFQTFRSSPEWSVVAELKKQYEVVQIKPNGPISDDLDGLLVILPSSLPQEEMDNVRAYIEGGKPALILVDPLPVIDLSMAPSERAGANRNPFQSQGQPPPTPKGDIEGMLAPLGIAWRKGNVVWDTYNPHPDLAHLPPEVVFVGAGNGNADVFNRDDRAVASLQELVFLYPGQLDKAVDSKLTFTPLLRSGRISGSFEYEQLVQRSFFGTQLNRNLRHQPQGRDFVLAAAIRGAATPAGDSGDDEGDDEGDESTEAADATPSRGVNVVVIADVDFISEQFFAIRRSGPGNLSFDNVTFFLNCMDLLVGDDSFVDLRGRRVAHRTLQRLEAQTRNFIEQRTNKEKEAETDAEASLQEAQQRLEQSVREVEQRTDLDMQAKRIMARNLQEVENRRFETRKASIESSKQAKIYQSKEEMEAQIRRIQGGIRSWAVMLPPIPVFLIGVVIYFRRRQREKTGAAIAHRLRG